MVTETPANRARALIQKARRRAVLHAARRALLSGVSAGALLAAAALAVAAAAGSGPGGWLLFALLPAAAVALLRLRAARPGLPEAALLLDRAAGTEERFVASLSARDREVREFVSRQALDAVPGRRLPLTFPPSAEGLAAVLSIALLAGLIFLLPDPGGPSGVDGDLRSGGRVPSTASASGAPDPSRADPRAGDGAVGEPRTDDRGDQPSADRGGPETGPGSEGGDSGTDPGAPAGPGAEENRAAAWKRFESSLESPGWHPRFDAVVREYFLKARSKGTSSRNR
jgi:hypothetical protein